MGESKHTPGPWQVMNEYDGATIVIANVDGETFTDGTSTFSYDVVCDTLPDDGDGSRSREIAIANAALIVRAVNAHDDLVAALKEARRWVEGNTAAVRGLSDRAAAPGEAMLTAIDAALAKAGASS